MQEKILKSLQAVALAGAVAVASGCASTASTSSHTLDGVHALAQEAMTAAQNAVETANAAAEAANGAQACCEANTRRMDAMFNDSMKSK